MATRSTVRNANGEGPYSIYGRPPPSNVPIPDPSIITAQEIAKVKDELRQENKLALDGMRQALVAAREGAIGILNARLEAMDKASTILEGNVNRVPTILDREISRVERLLEERVVNIQTHFDGINLRFHERDIRFDQDKRAVAAAMENALQAQKDVARSQNESVTATFAKSETSFTKEIDGLKALINATRDTISANVINLTGRLDRGEGGFQGAREAVTERHANTGNIVGIIGGSVGVVGLIAALIFGVVNIVKSDHAPAIVAAASPLAAENAKRLDDIISQTTEQNRLLNSRLDMLSNRLTNGQRPPP